MGAVPDRLSEKLEAALAAYIDEKYLDSSTAVQQLLVEGLEP